jgi:hypothetical protein
VLSKINQNRILINYRCRYAYPGPDDEKHSQVRLKIRDIDGTIDIVFAPLDFSARLAALAPGPRIHLTRLHGVFTPASALRTLVGRPHHAKARAKIGEMAEFMTSPPEVKEGNAVWTM